MNHLIDVDSIMDTKTEKQKWTERAIFQRCKQGLNISYHLTEIVF